jgi:hypothetical protein
LRVVTLTELGPRTEKSGVEAVVLGVADGVAHPAIAAVAASMANPTSRFLIALPL